MVALKLFRPPLYVCLWLHPDLLRGEPALPLCLRLRTFKYQCMDSGRQTGAQCTRAPGLISCNSPTARSIRFQMA